MIHCDECKTRPASVHYTRVINGDKTEMHLCNECAREMGEFPFSIEPSFSIHNFLAGFFGDQPIGSTALERQRVKVDHKCSECGLDFSEFAQDGLFGCGECYNSFRERVGPILKRIHGGSYHTGKVPRRTGGLIHMRKQIEALRRKLRDAVQKEAYEEAARIRDEIRKIEGSMKGES